MIVQLSMTAVVVSTVLLVAPLAYGADNFAVKNAGGSTLFNVTDTGNVGIGTATPSQALDIVAPNNGLVQFSSDTADNTFKASRMVLRHYSNSQLPVYLFGAASVSTDNYVAFGGGSSIGNAATQIDLYTAANNQTATGTPRLTVTSTGNIGIGTQAPTSKLQIVGLPYYANNAAASGNGLTPGALYWGCNGDALCVVH